MLPPAKRMAVTSLREDAMLSPKATKGNACNSVVINRSACLAFIKQVQHAIAMNLIMQMLMLTQIHAG